MTIKETETDTILLRVAERSTPARAYTTRKSKRTSAANSAQIFEREAKRLVDTLWKRIAAADLESR